MKKLIFLFALMFGLVLISNAQTTIATLSADKGSTYIQYTTDVTLTNTTAKATYFYFQPDQYTAQNFVVQLDSTGGNHTNVAVALYGRISDQQGWTAIGSAINWKGVNASVGADTTILFANSTEVAYRQFKLLFTGTGTGTTNIMYQAMKIWNGVP
jgi:hypothetical protein